MKIVLLIGKKHGLGSLKIFSDNFDVSKVYIFKEDLHEKEQFSKKIKEFCSRKKISCDYWKDENDLLKISNVDILVAIKWRFLFSNKVINLPKYGCFAIHDSLLPKYRGASPLNWAIANGESKVGATLFEVNENVDSGKILDQKSFRIKEDQLFGEINDLMYETYLDLIESLILKIKERNFRGKKQDESKASYCCRRTPEDGEINWSKNTREIFNLYRAVSPPAPGCFTFFNGKKIYILDCEIIDDRSSYVGSVSGRIVHSSKSEGYVDVLTGNGVLRLNLVKVGNAILPPSKIIKSISSTLGN